MYIMMTGEFPKAPQRILVCKNYGSPKRIFILRLVAHDILFIWDMFGNRFIIINQVRPFVLNRDRQHSALVL